MCLGNIKKFLSLHLLILSFCESINREIYLRSSSESLNPELVDATSFIIKNVFWKSFATVNVITSVEEPRHIRVQQFKDSLLHENPEGIGIFRLDNYTHIQNIKFRLKFYNIILLDSFESFEILYDRIVPEKFNFRGFYLIVLLYGLFPEINFIFQAMWKKSIINVDIMYDDGGVVKLVNFSIFSENLCGQPIVGKPNLFRNGTFMSLDEIFPDKVKNLRGCDIRVVTFHRCPAVCVSKNARGRLVVKGFDIGIIELIADELNFRPKMEILRGDEQWGTILEDGSTTGAISKIVEGEADIAIGNYLLRASRLKVMDSSNVYFSFPVVFAIPLGSPYRPFEKLFRPFQLEVWFILLLFLAVGVLVILVIRWKFKGLMSFVYGGGIRHPLNNMLIALFGGVQPKLPKRNFARFLLMMFLLLCLVKRNVYQGSLFFILQSDGRQKEVQSIQEMHEKGFDFYMYESYSDIIESQPKIFNKFEFHFNEFIVKSSIYFFLSLAGKLSQTRTISSSIGHSMNQLNLLS